MIRTKFPTRQVMPAMSTREMRVTMPSEAVEGAQPPTLFRFLMGLDGVPKPMVLDEIRALGDVFTRQILLNGDSPLTLRALDTAIARIQNPALPIRKLFLIAEGAQLRTAELPLELNTRLVFTWQASEGAPPDILLSTVPAADSSTALLQLIAWSNQDQAFHFFERKSGAWAWAGNSFHALTAPTRGQGPFDSHINGGLVMKELKRPWTHWHSENGSIAREMFGAESELNTDPLFQVLGGAENLESIVRAGVRRWTKGRFARHLREGVLNSLPDYLRQVLWCTSVNLVSSRDAFANSTVSSFDLPTSFFFDFDGIEFLASAIDPSVDVIPAQQFEVDATLYRNAVLAKRIAVSDDATPPVQSPGDTHFAFLVPERAFEDQVIVNELVGRGVLSARLALCFLLVDFSNPVFSPERARLLRYVPGSVAAGDGGGAFDRVYLDAIRQANPAASSPEGELLRLWDHQDLLGLTAQMLQSYHSAVQARLQTPQGVEDLVDLADSRREVLSRTRSLAEFTITLAHGPTTPQHLGMRPDGSLFVKTSETGEGEL